MGAHHPVLYHLRQDSKWESKNWTPDFAFNLICYVVDFLVIDINFSYFNRFRIKHFYFGNLAYINLMGYEFGQVFNQLDHPFPQLHFFPSVPWLIALCSKGKTRLSDFVPAVVRVHEIVNIAYGWKWVWMYCSFTLTNFTCCLKWQGVWKIVQKFWEKLLLP